MGALGRVWEQAPQGLPEQGAETYVEGAGTNESVPPVSAHVRSALIGGRAPATRVCDPSVAQAQPLTSSGHMDNDQLWRRGS